MFFLLLLLPQIVLSFVPFSGLHPSTHLQAYHFGQTNEKQKQSKDVGRSQRSTSYVPTGLTEEQYAQIKLADAAKVQGDLGAWGPRWNKISGDPQGNWFSMPGLWTGGYSRDAVGENTPNWLRSKENDKISLFRRVLIGCVLGLRRYGLAYLMLFVSAAYAMQYKQLSVKWNATRAISPLFVMKLIEVIVERVSWKVSWLRECGVTKLCAGLAVAISLILNLLRQ
eukprot:scaffold22098_cov76-Cyclotella_meneghiniana.AAC.4